jgi:ankyrin repeat protein
MQIMKCQIRYRLEFDGFIIDECTSLMKAIVDDDEKLVLHLLETYPFLINKQNNNGWSPVHVVVENYKSLSSFLPILIQHGADLNIKAFFGKTPLMFAKKISRSC